MYVLYRVWFAALELIVPVLLVTPFFIIWCRKRRFGLSKSLWHYFFMMYLFAVLGLTGFPSIRYFGFDPSLYLIPFVGMASDVKNSFLNVFLFIPLGFFLPFLSRKYDSFKSVFLFGLCVTCAIEFCQLFCWRLTDINDVITNCAGTALGYQIARPLKKPENRESGESVILILIGVVSAFMFLVQPYALPAIWTVLF